MAAGPPVWVEHFRKGQAAFRSGDLVAAQAHLADAQAVDTSGALELRLLKADILGADGQGSDAITVLEGAAEAFPNNHWPPFKMARLVQGQGDQVGAAACLAPALARDPDGTRPELWLLEADIALKRELVEQAGDALERLCAKHPDQPPLARHLTALARLPGGAARARDLFGQVLNTVQDPTAARLAYARMLSETGHVQDAIAQLEKLRTGQKGGQKGGQGAEISQVLIPLIQAYRTTGQMDEEEARLGAALQSDPLNPWLLRHLFSGHADRADLETQKQLLEAVRTKGGDALADELTTQMLVHTHDYAAALIAIRKARRRCETPADAQQMATTLMGTYRYRLGLRYLRLCLRRWPSAPGLIGLYVIWGLKLGQTDRVAAHLKTVADRLPAHMARAHQLMVQGFRDDFAGVVDTYETLRNAGHATAQHRHVLAKMIFTLAELDTVSAVFDRVGNPGAEGPLPLHRGGVPGMMAMELDFELQALADSGPYDSLGKWVRQRPHTPIPAIRLIDQWRKTAPATPDSGSDAIPKRIFQYWDQETRPDSIEAMRASWQIPGYEYRMMTRRDAVLFLRETFDADWVRAFQLANNPAEESDLLRLCLLSHHGGVWADADDVLYGDLGEVTRMGKGLIVYRETLGGALGNNVMAASPGHPAVTYAARLARQALLQRAVEMTWSKTGPGVLTRAVGQYIAQSDDASAREKLTVLPYEHMARIVGMHNPVRYKSSQDYWENKASRPPSAKVWTQALKGLE